MARISGVDIPKQKRGVISLTYIFGIGKSRAQTILSSAKVDESKKVEDWTDDETARIREAVGSFKIEGRATFRSPTKYKAFNGYRLLSWNPSQIRTSFTWSTNKKQFKNEERKEKNRSK